MITRDLERSDVVRNKRKLGGEYVIGHTRFPEDVKEGDLERDIRTYHLRHNSILGIYCLEKKKEYRIDLV